jgi:phospholipase/carboxylesterase
MLHGLGGNEHSMWALDSALPGDALIVSPRGLFPMGAESNSWVIPSLTGWPTVHDFESSVRALVQMTKELEAEASLDRENLILMGFSQGAALAFTAAPELAPAALIAAAGFIPQGDLPGLHGLPVFWGHGSFDEWIPITRARKEVKVLLELGAEVDFCETDVGHKLGLECLQGLRKWLRMQMSDP